MTSPHLPRRALLASGLVIPTLVGLAGCAEPSETKASSVVTPRAGRVRLVLNARAFHPPGTRSLAEALAGARDSEVVNASTAADQAAAVTGAAQAGFTRVVVQAIDPEGITRAIKSAAEVGVQVIALDTLPGSFDGVEAVVTWDEYGAGQQQVSHYHASLKGNGKAPHHLEMVGGHPDDMAAKARFTGAIKLIFQLAADGELLVKSGQTTWANVATVDAKALDKRLTTTYQVTYPRHRLEALIIGHDSYAVQVRATCARLKKPLPSLLSSDATVDGVRGVMAGSFHSTLYRDPAVLARTLNGVLETLRTGGELDHNPQAAHRNGIRDVPGLLASPALVTRANAPNLLSGNPELGKLTR